jgi:hypothetical protein
MRTRSGGGSDVGPPARMIRDVASNVSNAQRAVIRQRRGGRVKSTGAAIGFSNLAIFE